MTSALQPRGRWLTWFTETIATFAAESHLASLCAAIDHR